VVASIVAVIFTTHVFAASATALAVISGITGITNSFNQLDNAIGRHIKYFKQDSIQHQDTKIETLEKNITSIKELIQTRIEMCSTIKDSEQKRIKGREILHQTTQINDFVRKIKSQIPARTRSFTPLDPSPLLLLV